MASLFESLAVTGHRLSSGAANASGRCWVYKPGTTSPATIYADADETPLSNPVTLSAGGKAQIFFTGQVDVFFEDSTGVAIETLSLSERAERVEVKSAGFTGLLPSGSLGAGGATDLKTVLASLYASTGGLDGKYLEYTGATARNVHDVLQGIQVSVKDYGAVGNGVADDTVAIQNAINEAARLGGAVVYLDPGNYKTSSALLLSSVTGVTILGAGIGASKITATNGIQNGFTITSSTSCRFTNFNLTHVTTSTGIAFSVAASTDVSWVQVAVNMADPTTDVFTGGSIFVSGSTSYCRVLDCTVSGVITLGPSGASNYYFVDDIFCKGLTLDGTVANCFVSSSRIGTLTFAVTLTGNSIAFVGTLVTSSLVANTTGDISLFTAGNKWASQTLSFAVGTSQTPQVISGFSHLTASSGGAGAVTVNLPAMAIGTNRTVFYISFTNASGGAVTWNLNAAYKLAGGVAIPATNNTTTVVGFQVDIEAGGYREVTRANSTT